MENSNNSHSENDMYFATLGYFGPLFIIPLIFKRKSAYCRFHAYQSMFMFLLFFLIPLFFVLAQKYVTSVPDWLGGILVLVLYIVAIISTLTLKTWQLPLIGPAIVNWMGLLESPTTAFSTGKVDNTPKIYGEGWLSFLIYTLVISTILIFFGGITDMYLLFAVSKLNGIQKYISISYDFLYFGSLVLFGLLTITSLKQLKPNAISLAKMYVLLIFSMNLSSVIFSINVFPNYSNSQGSVVKAVFVSILWFLFLTFSKKVGQQFPKKEQKTQILQVVYFLAILSLPIFLHLLTVIKNIQTGEVSQNISNFFSDRPVIDIYANQ